MNSVLEDLLKGELNKFPLKLRLSYMCFHGYFPTAIVIVHFKPPHDSFYDECQMFWSAF